MNTLWIILGWVLCGLVVGLIARLLVWGRQPAGFLRTILLGIVGAIAGGLIRWAIEHQPGEPWSLSANAWPGWLFAILGAVVVLLLYGWWHRQQSWWRRWW
jgi:uncharacterized membrane protein YeaQ/YmgE (transglycosylase-associated protein family)